jgi:hypothetical protein
MTTETDLLPCPFCGLDVTDDEGCFPLNREGTRWEVRCGNPSCFAYDPCDESMQAAVARWNRRATAAQAAEIEALRAEVARLVGDAMQAQAEAKDFKGACEVYKARAERLAELLDQAYGYVPAGTLADQIHCALLRDQKEGAGPFGVHRRRSAAPTGPDTADKEEGK